MTDNPASEAHNELANSNYTPSEITRLAIPYILHGFVEGIEERHITSLTIQRVDNRTVKGFIRCVTDLGLASESGFVAYSELGDAESVLEFFEQSLAWGDMPWRVDHYHRSNREPSQKSRSGRSKIKLG